MKLCLLPPVSDSQLSVGSDERNYAMRKETLLLSLLTMGLMSTPMWTAGPFKNSVGDEQSARVNLKGQVIEFRVLNEDKNRIRFLVKLRLTFVNDGHKSAILLKQTFEVGAEMLSLSCEDAKTGEYLFTSTHWPSVSTASEWADWRQKLDRKTPPEDLVSVLAPGNSIFGDAETTIHLPKISNFEGTNKTWNEVRRSATMCLTIQLQTWPTNLEPNHNPENPTFGQSLRKRWSSYGRLQLELLTSEPILLNLPQSSSSTPVVGHIVGVEKKP
jgi:hypothetical protein